MSARQRKAADPSPEFLTVAEVASLWAVSSDTVRRQIKAGLLPAVRIGRAIRVRKDAARRFIRDCRIVSRSAQ